jgi:hypothetical protein
MPSIAGCETKAYNALPSLATAHTMLMAEKNLDIARERLRPVFLRHKAERFWGLSLLHRHWPLEAGEIAVQSYHPNLDGYEYRTMPVKRYFDYPWPSSMIVAERPRMFNVFEWSTDNFARTANEFLSDSPRFLDEVYEEFCGNELCSVFGISLARDVTCNGNELVEHTLENRVSVIREVRPDQIARHTLTETLWVFSDDKVGMVCKSKCFETDQHQQYHDPNG